MGRVTASILAVVLLVCGGWRPASAEDPFASMSLVPADATCVIHVDDAATLRRTIASRPIARFFDAILLSRQSGQSWRRLAHASGRTDAELFDFWLGRRCTLVLRKRDGWEWAIITEADRDRVRPIIRMLGAKRLLPRHELPMLELPEHALRLAWDGDRWLIGPTDSVALFDEILPRLAGVAVEGETLADRPAAQTAKELGPGSIGVYIRHDPPLGGYSLIAATLEGDRLRFRHAGEFEASPMMRPISKTTWDMSPLDALERHSLLAFIEPTNVGPSDFEMYCQATLGEPLLSREMQENLGTRRMIVVGEIDGRLEERTPDMLLPTAAIAIEVRDSRTAAAELDSKMWSLTQSAKKLVEGRYVIEAPKQPAFTPGKPRHIPMKPSEGHVPGTYPITDAITFNWTAATGPNGSYYVIATHPEQLRELVTALTGEPRSPARNGEWDMCGSINGVRLGIHLRNIADHADFLAAGDEAEIEAFRETMRNLSRLTAGIDRCRWRLDRPTETSVRLDVKVRLAPSESSAGK
jgi:hypothetical protein